MNDWGKPLRYRSDDADLPRGDNDLVIFMGENGDWYVSVVPHGDKLGPAVRITTSGQRTDGLVVAMSTVYRALSGQPIQFLDFDAWMTHVQGSIDRDMAAMLRADQRVADVAPNQSMEAIRQRYERCVYRPGEPADENRLQVHRDVWALIKALETSEELLSLAGDRESQLAELVQLRNARDQWELRALSEKSKREVLEAAVDELEQVARGVEELTGKLLARAQRTRPSVRTDAIQAHIAIDDMLTAAGLARNEIRLLDDDERSYDEADYGFQIDQVYIEHTATEGDEDSWHVYRFKEHPGSREIQPETELVSVLETGSLGLAVIQLAEAVVADRIHAYLEQQDEDEAIAAEEAAHG